MKLIDEINSFDKVVEILKKNDFEVSWVEKTADALFPTENSGVD